MSKTTMTALMTLLFAHSWNRSLESWLHEVKFCFIKEFCYKK